MDIIKKSEKEAELEAFIKNFIKKSTRFSGMPVSVLKNKPEIICEFDKYRERIKEQKQVDLTNEMTIKTADQKAKIRKSVAASVYMPDLPRWSDEVRGVPNGVLRSALFGAIRRGARASMLGERIASVDDISILYSGFRLDQADLDVWEQCLHLAQIQGLGSRISFTAHEMLKSIGRKTGGSDIEWLKNVFRRLSGAVVEIQHGNRAYSGNMVYGGQRDDSTGLYAIAIHPDIAKLFGDNGWTGVNRQQRRELKQPLAQWLHAFYSTHERPFPYKVETLHCLCGSECASMRHYRANLKTAIKSVEDVTSWKIWIDNDLVYIKKHQKIAPV